MKIMKIWKLNRLATLALAGAFSLTAFAQTTEEGAGPSEHPSAPMEIGQPQAQQSPNMPPPPQAGQPQQPGPPQPGQPEEEPQMGEAQPGGPTGEGPAKTNQGVGHISMIHGEVSTQRGDSGTWSAAILNQPVVNGDKVSTGAAGRTEVQLDYSNIFRLSANAQANIANFTNRNIQIQIGQGLANYTVWGESDAEPEIDTPNVGVHPAHQDGVYRIEVLANGDSIVIVRKGMAQISTPQGIAEVKQGEMATVRGSGADAKYKIGPAPARDDWDIWNIDRDRMIHDASSWKHTNRYYTGSEDLDAYGSWQNVPDYGDVWVPNESADWAPYRDGNWTYEPYWGWTWVGYEPWGWAPYHYGRWLSYGGGWAWWPGPVYVGYRPFWAPAYVSFFGWPGWGWGWGFGWGGWGGFGWLALGPGDRFFPWWGGYGGRFGYVGYGRFNGLGRFGGIAPLHAGTRFSNIAHINDAHIGAGVSTVAGNRFGAGHTTAVAASHAQLSGARMMTGNMPVVPTRASLSASGRAADPSTIHSGAVQHFYGKPSTSHTQSFEQQTARLQQSMAQNHVSAATAGGREANTEVRSTSAGATGKSSAGVSASRNDSADRSQTAGKSESASASHSASSNSEWKSFTPEAHNNDSRSNDSAARSGEAAGRESGAARSEGSYWNRTGSSNSAARGSSYGAGSSYSRPQLNMHQPIAQPRSNGGYGGYHGSPGYEGSHGGSRGGSSGGGSHSSAPSGGGHSSGGGGGHSGGGGGHH